MKKPKDDKQQPLILNPETLLCQIKSPQKGSWIDTSLLRSKTVPICFQSDPKLRHTEFCFSGLLQVPGLQELEGNASVVLEDSDESL